MGESYGESPKHYVVLDSLRGVCACMVVLLHFSSQGAISAAPLVKHGFLFVDFFFVLSGFVIGSRYGERLAAGYSVWQFMWRRLGRIYPLHVAMLLLFLGVEIVLAACAPDLASRRPFTGNFSVESFVQSLLLVQIFVGPDAMPWNGPSWSIAAEIWVYLLFALVLRFAFFALVPLCIIIAIAVPIQLGQLTDRYINLFHDGAFARCLFGFALGLIGWQMARRVRATRLPLVADELLEIAVVAAIFFFVSRAGAGPLSLAAPFLFLIAVLVFARERGMVSALLRLEPFVTIGMLSYSIYMIHGFLYYRLLNGLGLFERMTGHELLSSRGGHNSVGGGPLFGDEMSLAFLGLVIFCSYASYSLIEKPGRDWSRRPPAGWFRWPVRPAPAVS